MIYTYQYTQYSTLKPATPNNVKNEILLQKQKQKSYYDEIAKPLHYQPPIKKGEIIRLLEFWGRIIEKSLCRR